MLQVTASVLFEDRSTNTHNRILQVCGQEFMVALCRVRSVFSLLLFSTPCLFCPSFLLFCPSLIPFAFLQIPKEHSDGTNESAGKGEESDALFRIDQAVQPNVTSLYVAVTTTPVRLSFSSQFYFSVFLHPSHLSSVYLSPPPSLLLCSRFSHLVGVIPCLANFGCLSCFRIHSSNERLCDVKMKDIAKDDELSFNKSYGTTENSQTVFVLCTQSFLFFSFFFLHLLLSLPWLSLPPLLLKLSAGVVAVVVDAFYLLCATPSYPGRRTSACSRGDA